MSGEPDRVVKRGRIVAALLLAMALAAMDTTIVATAVPQIVGDLGGFSSFSWVFSGYLLAQTVTIPVYGKLADLYGRRPILIAGICVFLLGSLLCGVAWNMPSLILFRVLQGLGAGGIQATVQTVAADLYGLAERGRIQAGFSSVWGIASIVGPAFGGLLATEASWRWIFLANLPVGAVALWLIARHLREDVTRTRHRIDYLGATLILLAGSTLIFALLQGGITWAWLSVPSLSLLVGAAALTVAVILVERRAAEPILPPWVWRRPVLVGSNLSLVSLGVILIGPATFLPVYGQSVLGLGAVAAGLLPATMSMSWPITAALSGRLYLRIGFRDTALIGAVIGFVATAGMVVLPGRASVWQVVVLTLLLGAGLGLLSAPLLIGIQSTVHWGERGVVTASGMFSRFLGQSLGAALFGAVVNSVLSARLHDAPARLRDVLPDIDGVAESLEQGGAASTPAGHYLRDAMAAAIHSVYIGAAVATALAIVLLLTLTPRHFPVVAPEAESKDPTGADD